MLGVAVYVIGWLLFVAAQAQNSVRSIANSLEGWPGVITWLKFQAVNLATRAFFCSVLYPVFVNDVRSRIQAAGLVFTSVTISAFAGYGSNAMFYQMLGYLPFFRVEISSLAPPSAGPVSAVTKSLSVATRIPIGEKLK
jgi:hypothetical protein